MTGKEFIFSVKPGIRFARHLVFWTLCFIYLMYFLYHGGISLWPEEKALLFKASELFVLFLIIIPFTYWVLFKLIPDYFLKKRIVLFIVISILSLLIIEILLYFNYLLIYYLIHPVFFGFQTNIMHENAAKYLLSPLVARILPITGIAITLKYLKVTWQKQSEIEKLEKEKLIAELNLLKTQVSTDFIFSSLDSITHLSEKASPDAPRQVLHLSELLRYLVYEARETTVSLSKELEIIRNYVSLMSNEEEKHTDCSLQISGNPGHLSIEPLLLLSIVQAVYNASCNYNGEGNWITIDLKIDRYTVNLKINYCSSPDNEKDLFIRREEFDSIFQRLQLTHPDLFDLKHIEDNDISMLSLRLILQEYPKVKIQPDEK